MRPNGICNLAEFSGECDCESVKITPRTESIWFRCLEVICPDKKTCQDCDDQTQELQSKAAILEAERIKLIAVISIAVILILILLVLIFNQFKVNIVSKL
jgi:hypothetical protein